MRILVFVGVVAGCLYAVGSSTAQEIRPAQHPVSLQADVGGVPQPVMDPMDPAQSGKDSPVQNAKPSPAQNTKGAGIGCAGSGRLLGHGRLRLRNWRPFRILREARAARLGAC